MAVPRLDYADIVGRANEVYRRHHPSDVPPVDIEKIIDNDFRIDVFESDGLMDKLQIDAYLTHDLKEIHVDKRIYDQKPPNRLRFSLAHEFAHLILHSEYYQAMKPETPDEWKAAMKRQAQNDYDHLEWQANVFAGLFLVPPHLLEIEVQTIRQGIQKAGINPDAMHESAFPRITRMIAQKFQVSTQVIEKRLHKDDLWPMS